MTPGHAGSRCMSRWKYIAALRALKAPFAVWFSCLSHTAVPNAAATCGHTYCGVGGTSVAMNCPAGSMAARSGNGWLMVFTACMVIAIYAHDPVQLQYS